MRRSFSKFLRTLVRVDAAVLAHDSSSRNTCLQLKQVFDAIRELMTPPEPKSGQIGFIQPEEKAAKK